MDLFCPHCSKRVSVPDDKASQVMSCPSCGKQFMAPSLPPASVAPPPPPPASSAQAPDVAVSPGLPPYTPTSSSDPASPPPPPGDYTRSCGFSLNPNWLVFVPVGCLIAIFILSFFTWHNIDRDHAPSLWGLAFVDQKLDDVRQAHFLAYLIFIFPTGLVVIGALVVNKVPVPPQILPAKGWLDLAAGALLSLTFLMLVVDYADSNLLARFNPITVPLKLAFRLHFLAVLASFALFWLHWRKKSNLPLPRLECKW